MLRTSLTRAKAVITNDKGEVTDFSTPASRSEYWWFEIFRSTALMVVMAGVLAAPRGPVMIAMLAASVLLIIPGISAGARRFRDAGVPSWAWIAGLVILSESSRRADPSQAFAPFNMIAAMTLMVMLVIAALPGRRSPSC